MRHVHRSHPGKILPPTYVRRRALLTLLAVLAIGLAFLFSAPTQARERERELESAAAAYRAHPQRGGPALRGPRQTAGSASLQASIGDTETLRAG